MIIIDKVGFNCQLHYSHWQLSIVNFQLNQTVTVVIHTTHHHHHPPPRKLYFAVSQLPVVGFEHVRSFFDCTQSQESKFYYKAVTGFRLPVTQWGIERWNILLSRSLWLQNEFLLRFSGVTTCSLGVLVRTGVGAVPVPAGSVESGGDSTRVAVVVVWRKYSILPPGRCGFSILSFWLNKYDTIKHTHTYI